MHRTSSRYRLHVQTAIRRSDDSVRMPIEAILERSDEPMGWDGVGVVERTTLRFVRHELAPNPGPITPSEIACLDVPSLLVIQTRPPASEPDGREWLVYRDVPAAAAAAMMRDARTAFTRAGDVFAAVEPAASGARVHWPAGNTSELAGRLFLRVQWRRYCAVAAE